MKLLSKLTAILALTAFACILNAEGLTEKTIQKWIKAYPAVNAWMEEHEDVLDTMVDEDDMEDMDMEEAMLAGFEALKNHPIFKELNAVVKPLGYSSAEAMMLDTMSIFKAYTALAMEKEMVGSGGFDMSQMEAQIAQIDEMEGLSDEQKAMMKEQLQSVFGQVGSMMDAFSSVPEADKEAIAPFYEQIGGLLETIGGDDEDYDY